MRRWLLVFLSLTGACGGSGEGDDAPSDWTPLIGRSWSVPSGTLDEYRCVRIEIPETIFVTGFRSVAPPGSHHAVLTRTRSSTQLGEYDCSVGALDLEMLYASGIGTDDLQFPEGVAVRLTAGHYLNLNLHVFNAGDTDLSGTSGVEVKTIPESAVVNEAEMIFAGTTDIAIPPDNQPYTTSGGCTVGLDYSVVALWPHMHQYGVHQKYEITRVGTTAPTAIIDAPFSFESQGYFPQATPLELHQGDRIRTTCTYINDGADWVSFGDSSNAEMCFTGMYRYPAGGGILLECVEGGAF